MLSHLFKLIWNKKKQNFLIMLELFFSFLAMFAVFTMITNYYQFYNTPAGFEPSNVWTINRTIAENNGEASLRADSALLLDKIIRQQIKSMPEVADVTFTTANTPYSNTGMAVQLQHNNLSIRTDIYTVEENYPALLNINIHSGRWFSKADEGVNYSPIVMNVKLKEKLFGEADALQQTIRLGGTNYKVVGIVENLKSKGDYVEPEYGLYIRPDSSFYGNRATMLVKVKPGADAGFEARLFKTLSNLMDNTSIKIDHLEDSREVKNQNLLLPIILLLIVIGFFITNVAFGLFGVLWHSVNKRKSEIGLRRAVGASEMGIAKQLVGEALVLSTISLVAGLFFAIQFPLLNIFDLPAGTYFIAIILAVIFIYALAIICSLYPGKRAASLYPAVALHEE